MSDVFLCRLRSVCVALADLKNNLPHFNLSQTWNLINCWLSVKTFGLSNTLTSQYDFHFGIDWCNWSKVVLFTLFCLVVVIEQKE